MERFPFEGTVVAVDGERYRLNLGKPYRVGRGTEFSLLAAEAVKGDSSPARSRDSATCGSTARRTAARGPSSKPSTRGGR